MIPFPVIYFGTILFFFALDGKGIVKDLPAYDDFLDFKSSPTQSTAVLVSTSALVVVPLLGLWRAFLKRHVFSAMAERWAGLKPGSAVHVRGNRLPARNRPPSGGPADAHATRW
jgi:hypothetical protein